MIRTFAILRSISPPFNAGTTEVKLTFDPLYAIEGEIYIRVPSASGYVVGDTYAVSIQRIE
jgi:hypothetical protein